MDSLDDRDLREDARTDISVLASTVISVLSDKPPLAAHVVRPSVVRKLVRATLSDGAFNGESLLADLEDGRLGHDQIVDIYIPEAARELGAMWMDDTIGFAGVTIATARLQGLLTLIAPPWSPATRGEERNVLFVLPTGDSHTLGPHVAAAQLRRTGATVRMLFAPTLPEIERSVAEEPYDLIMLSAARLDDLETVARIVKRLQASVAKTPPIVLGGLVLSSAERVKERTGVDLVTGDVRVALRLCDNNRVKPRLAARR